MPGKSDNLLVGLSMGTTKTTMIVAEKNSSYPDSVHVIGFGNADSKGVSKGIIVSLQDARQSVIKAFQEAQSITGISASRLSNVIVAFNAMDVQSETTHGMVTLGGRDSKAVQKSDLNRVIDRARDDLALRSNMYSLHMIPTSYELDSRQIDEPLNMNGNQLDLWLQTVAVPMTYAQNVVNCVQTAGLSVRGLVLKPLAASLGAVYEEEMRAGCISICIGGGTTGIVLYRGGRAFKIISIPIGGDHIRSDLALMLKIPLGEAEHLKKRFFTTEPDILKREGINYELAAQAILTRFEELFGEFIYNALAECTPQHFPGGIILSGGVSATPGIDEMLQSILQMPVRKVIEPIYAMPYGLNNASYVSEAGILKFAVMTERDPYLFMESDQILPGLSERSDMRRRQEQKRIEHEARDNPDNPPVSYPADYPEPQPVYGPDEPLPEGPEWTGDDEPIDGPGGRPYDGNNLKELMQSLWKRFFKLF